MNRKRLIIILIAITIIGAGIYWWMSQSRNVLNVIEIPSEQIEVKRTVSASGSVLSHASANLAFSGSGRVVSLNVKEGEKVKKGQVLARVDSYSESQSAQAAKFARDALIRDRDLFIEQYADNLEAAGGRSEYQLQLEKKNEQVRQAEANYQASLGNLRDLTLTAPFDAMVVDVIAKSGEISTAGTTAIIIADTAQLYFDVSLDQEDFSALKLDQEVEIELDSYPDTIFNGKVIKLPEYAKTQNDNEEFNVQLSIEAKEGMPVLLNMKGEAAIIVEKTEGTVTALPFDAVAKEGDSHFIWINDNGEIKKLSIEIGVEGDIYTEIKTDISGKQVIAPAATNIDLRENAKAKVVSQ